MLRKEDDIKIKCLKELGEMEADTVKCNQDKEKRKRNNAIREKGDSLGARCGAARRDRGRNGGWNRDEGERARREQTLMPPCRPQMLHQLQTSSFLRSPSFPSSRPPQIEKERQGDICRIQTYHIPSHLPSSSLLSSALIFSLSPFRRLSTRPRGDDIGYTQKKEREETHGRHGRDGGAQRDTNFRLNLTQGAKGRQGAARCCFR